MFKKERVDRTSTFRGGVAWKEGVTFFRGGLQFLQKNKLKSEIFNDKKKFISWEISPKNLVTFKR